MIEVGMIEVGMIEVGMIGVGICASFHPFHRYFCVRICLQYLYTGRPIHSTGNGWLH